MSGAFPPQEPAPASEPFSFEVVARDGRARAGLLRTPHGVVETPCFMPVGTKGTVKAVAPRSLRELGARIVLANTYHLFFRPGAAIVAAHGGLHLQDGTARSSRTPAAFRCSASRRPGRSATKGRVHLVYDGSVISSPRAGYGGPAGAGADIVMCLDQCFSVREQED